MYSDPFTLLGLDRATATDADVRRAYAGRLKVTRPEDDREGFMALRAAFEQARREVRNRELYGAYDEDDEAEEDTDEAGATSGEARKADAPDDQDNAQAAPEPASILPPEAYAAEASTAEEETFDEEAEADYHTDADRHLDAAMSALQAAMRDPWGAKSGDRVLAIIEAPEVSGIDEYQALQWRVRDWLCNETGYFADPRQLNPPTWLSLPELEVLDVYFGWTAQPSRQSWIRDRNDWIHSLKERLTWDTLPKDVRKRRELDKRMGTQPPPERKPVYISKGHSRWEKEPGRRKKRGGMFWFWVGFGILAFNILRALG